MSTLLHLDASPLGDRSVSRQLSAEYARAWVAAHPRGTVIRRDLAATVIPPVDAAWIQAAYTPAEARTPEQNRALALSDELIAELRLADRWICGVPMHNFSIPSTMKLWIDQIARVNETFRYGEQGPQGLITGKAATIIATSGGNYGPETALQSLNFVEPYLRAVLGFLGVTDVDVLTAGGTAALSSPGQDREKFFEPQIEAIRARFAA